jgi:ATP-dependent Clp protease ATP-binding subunit ClpX
LDAPALLRILVEPKNALVRQYQALFEMEGVDLTFEPDALREIVDRTVKRKTGARGLRSFMESALLDIMFDLPSIPNLSRVIITAQSIRSESKPILEYAQASRRKSA